MTKGAENLDYMDVHKLDPSDNGANIFVRG